MSTGSNPCPDLWGNEKTRAGAVPWLDEPFWSHERVFVHHFQAIREARDRARGHGYLVVAVYGNETLTGQALLESTVWGAADRTLIVGRHEQAPMRLAKDVRIALRHLLVRVTLGDCRTPMVRVLDLKTGQGFVVEGAGACRSVASDGCLFMRVGSYALMFFPVSEDQAPWPGDPRAAWQSLPPRTVVDKRDAPQVWDALSAVEARAVFGSEEISNVTVLPGVLGIDCQPMAQPVPIGTYGVLTLAEESQESFYPVTRRQLERGVLLGRYRRCDVGSSVLRHHETVSRVHLLLLKEEETVLAIDTASSNGTRVDGVSISAIELPDAARIELARGTVIRWTKTEDARAEAAHLAGESSLN